MEQLGQLFGELDQVPLRQDEKLGSRARDPRKPINLVFLHGFLHHFFDMMGFGSSFCKVFLEDDGRWL